MKRERRQQRITTKDFIFNKFDDRDGWCKDSPALRGIEIEDDNPKFSNLPKEKPVKSSGKNLFR